MHQSARNRSLHHSRRGGCHCRNDPATKSPRSSQEQQVRVLAQGQGGEFPGRYQRSRGDKGGEITPRSGFGHERTHLSIPHTEMWGGSLRNPWTSAG